METKKKFEILISEIIDFERNETLTEGLIVEQKMNSLVRKIVRDIINLLKKENEGSFELPSDVNSEEELYSSKDFDTEFSLEVNLKYDENINKFKMDANFYKDEDTLEINIVLNPKTYFKDIQNMIGPLNELLVHELTHLKQYERGENLPDEEPESNFEYYTQPHELEAQYKGFKRRAKKEKRSIDSVMDEWFKENQNIHNLSSTEVKKLKNAILNWEFY